MDSHSIISKKREAQDQGTDYLLPSYCNSIAHFWAGSRLKNSEQWKGGKFVPLFPYKGVCHHLLQSSPGMVSREDVIVKQKTVDRTRKGYT